MGSLFVPTWLEMGIGGKTAFDSLGWYVYGCFQEGCPKTGHASPDVLPGFCGLTAPWSSAMGPNLQDHVSAVFFLAFLLFSWTTGSIMSGGGPPSGCPSPPPPPPPPPPPRGG